MTARSIALALTRRPQCVAGNGYLVPCPVPSHGKGRGDRTPSLQISDGDKALLVHCYAGCSSRDVIDELRRRGLLDDGDGRRHHRRPQRSAETLNHGQTEQDNDHQRRQRHKAARLWSQREQLTDTPAERYLRQVRGITCPLPPTFGYLAPRGLGEHHALIAAFAFPVDEPEPGMLAVPHNVGAVHLTLLRADGTKADVKPNKIAVGSHGGTPIVVAPCDDLLSLAITEGIEDALALHQALGVGAWAAGSASFMPKLAKCVPDYVESVIVELHPDGGRRYAVELIDALRRRGVEVTTRKAMA
jgi:hypothetical protein